MNKFPIQSALMMMRMIESGTDIAALTPGPKLR